MKLMMGVTALAVMMFAFAAPAQADSVNSLLVSDVFNTISDESAEYVGLAGADGSGSYLNRLASDGIGGYGALTVGKVLRGALDFNTISTIFGSNDVGSSGNDVLQAVFSSKIVAFADVDGLGGANDIVFGPDPDFDDWLSELHTTYGQTDSTVANAVPTGTIARFFTHSLGGSGNDSDLVSVLAGGPDANVATHSDGSYFWDLGFDGTSDNVWVAFNAANPVPGTSDSFAFANGNFALSVLGYGVGKTVVPHAIGLNNLGIPGTTLVDITGSLSVRGDGNSANAGFHATNNTQIRLKVIPLPAAAWMGLAMLGAIGIRRRLRRRS